MVAWIAAPLRVDYPAAMHARPRDPQTLRDLPLRLLLGAALSGWGCAGSTDGSTDCASLESSAKDRCFHDQLLAVPATDPDAVIALSQQISDPMIRGAAVSAWVGAHVNEVPMDKGRALCDLLDGRDRGYCERRLSSPHLQRP